MYRIDRVKVVRECKSPTAEGDFVMVMENLQNVLSVIGFLYDTVTD